MRRAVDELVQDGVVERFRGRGTVVLDTLIDYPIQKNNRFTETLTKLDQKPISQILKPYAQTVFEHDDGGSLHQFYLSRMGCVFWITLLI